MHTYEVIQQGCPLRQAKKALILLHGRGSTALDILSLADSFADDSFYIAAPQATRQSWYPHSFMAEEAQNEPWISSAIEIVKKLVENTTKHVPLDKIYLMGFSQGACLALEFSARYAAKYGGIVAFTGGLIGKTQDEEKYQGNFAGTKIFIGTSDQDPHVPLIRSEQSKLILEKMGAAVTLKVYAGMAHTINEDEINWVRKFIF